MPLIDSDAVVLRTYSLSEADKIVVCLTRKSGVIRGVAHGARRLRSRFGAGLEPLTLLHLCYYEKEGRELASIRHLEILRSYFGLAASQDKVGAMSYMSELLLEFAQPKDPNEILFRMVTSCLDAFETSIEKWRPVIRYFEIWILRLSGFFPDLSSCIICRKRFSPGDPISLDVEFKPRCTSCRKRQGTVLSCEAQAQFRDVQRLSPTDFTRTSSGLSDHVFNEMATITYGLITRALDRQPRGHSNTL